MNKKLRGREDDFLHESETMTILTTFNKIRCTIKHKIIKKLHPISRKIAV